MNRSLTMRLLVTALFLSAVTGLRPARAETLLQATLDGSQVAPPSDSDATGTATLILNDAQTQVEYVVMYAGLEGEETDAHFHQGGPGEDGPILHHLPLGSPKFGTWDVDAHEVGYLLNGMVYVNIHTTTHVSGEIRGDITESTAGLTLGAVDTSWGRIKALFNED
ncbi:MAG: CHRD domain-containing protein [Candidatus Eisenbacteria bacterium]|nr:CHRD domain-containing protein [Candidatus Eisenbacteria bacterium]